MNMKAESIQEHWAPISHFFSVTNEEEYDRAVELLDSLLDEIGTDERHPLYEFLDTLGTVIQAYEEKNYPFPDCDGISMLCYFMDEYGLTASDLPEIGSQETVSAIISGKKELSLRQVRALSKRFHVSSAVFV
ncbi:transcriptional regulator [Desulfobulbus sp. US1]|nr:transcriptional regulator [Desulfobulbus sp. US4]MCW5207825.1 transcriptional regulator [Desulfobulbus sp. US2]MCW5208758.1 transcriptional regulator [Desulfobulbus sp. US1]MCW5214326.1 transcriptional regulator [Desulfobulbus sp. US5]